MRGYLGIATIVLVASIPQTPREQASNQSNPPIEILGFKIGSDYYPMLDSKSPVITADNPDFPRTEGERIASQSSRRRNRMEESRSQGKLRSTVKVISDANFVNLTIRNTETKTIKVVEWDFAFPRYVEGKMVLRYNVVSKTEIKPHGKTSLKQPLPAGATRCKIVNVEYPEEQKDKAKISEAVCGPGVHDPSLLQQETVSIKRIEYADGAIWQRK